MHIPTQDPPKSTPAWYANSTLPGDESAMVAMIRHMQSDLD